MSRQWDPLQSRKSLLDPRIGYARDLAADVEQMRQNQSMGNAASLRLGTAIECYLCGLDDPAVEVLQMAQELLVTAIETRERSRIYANEEGYASLLFSRLASCRWLLHSVHDEQSLRHYLDHEERYLAAFGRLNGEALDGTLPQLLDAGAFEQVCEVFEQNSRRGLPKNLKSVRTERAMAYLLAQRQLGRIEVSEEQLAQITRRFLDHNMDENWLDRGLYKAAALWMKIVHWNGSGRKLSARDTVLKCYDHLPGREYPGA